MGNWNKWPGLATQASESLHTVPNLAQHLLNLTQAGSGAVRERGRERESDGKEELQLRPAGDKVLESELELELQLRLRLLIGLSFFSSLPSLPSLLPSLFLST